MWYAIYNDDRKRWTVSYLRFCTEPGGRWSRVEAEAEARRLNDLIRETERQQR